jgi:signal transduction histidine kinase
MALSSQTWYTPEQFDTELLQDENLSANLNLSEKRQWHYINFSELDEEQALLLILHTDSPAPFTRNNRIFLSRLKDHGIIALKNALLYEELHEAIRAKNEFIGFISHELKNPLTVIKGYADILRKGMAGQVTEEQVDYLSTITHNVRRMNTFITDLSDQAHIETKSLRLDFEPTPVHEVVSEVLHSYEALIEKKSLDIDLHLPGDIPDVWCDRMRLIQVLANLISNAVKYSPEGRTIQIGTEQAVNSWDIKGAAEVVHFWVQDQGYGIAEEDQAHLFEKFYRGSDLRVKKIPGTGLGLRISKSLVEMMGGKMWFESVLEVGSTFHFTLPI